MLGVYLDVGGPSGSRAPRAGAGRTRSLQAADDLNINIMTPAEIKEGLDQYVIGQDEASAIAKGTPSILASGF